MAEARSRTGSRVGWSRRRSRRRCRSGRAVSWPGCRLWCRGRGGGCRRARPLPSTRPWRPSPGAPPGAAPRSASWRTGAPLTCGGAHRAQIEDLGVPAARRVVGVAGGHQVGPDVAGRDVVCGVIRYFPHQQRADRVGGQLAAQVGPHAFAAVLDPYPSSGHCLFHLSSPSPWSYEAITVIGAPGAKQEACGSRLISFTVPAARLPGSAVCCCCRCPPAARPTANRHRAVRSPLLASTAAAVLRPAGAQVRAWPRCQPPGRLGSRRL